MRSPFPVNAVLFGVVVATCLAQVSWWMLFQFREANRLEVAAQHLVDGDIDAAVTELGAAAPAELAETAKRRRTMFAMEGATLGLLGLTGVVFFYTAMVRERRRRLNQERFLTGATHELKTPLTTMRLGLESLADGRVSKQRHDEYLAAMLRETDRLEGGLTNLLVAAGLDESRTKHNPTEGDLAVDVENAIEHFRPRYEAVGIALTADHLEPCPTTRDGTAIRLVIDNLLSNALKYSEKGGAVTVALSRDEANAKLTVTDRGLGIAAADLPHVFERFYRGRDKAHIGGTGIGLSIAAELVGLHGGKIKAQSDGPGHGSSFAITLPRGGRK